MLSDEKELIDWFKNLSLLNKQTLYTWSYIVLFDKQNNKNDGGKQDDR